MMNLVFINIKKYFLSCSILFLRRNQLLRSKWKILLFDFIVFFLFLFMRHEPGIWWKCGDHDAGKNRGSPRNYRFRESYTITISGPTSVEPKNARAGETIQFSELASGNYSERLRIPLRRKDRSAFISKGKDDRQSF